MRPGEILLLLANLLAFCVLAIPRLRAARWTRYAPPGAPLVAGAQALVEGLRWTMIPAYTLSGIFFLVWLLQRQKPAGATPAPSRTNRLAAGFGIGLGALGLAASIVLPIILPVFRFARPTGPYTIGTLTYHWVDANRAEIVSADSDARRELMAQIWYPARPDAAAPRAPYVQDANALTAAFARVQQRPELLLAGLKRVTTHAIPSAPVADDEPIYPVLLFLEGTTGYRQMNTFQVEELVSHGYIVVGIDQPYMAAAVVVFPDGRQAAMPSLEVVRPLIRAGYIPPEPAPTLNGTTLEHGVIPYLAQDAIFTLDQLTALNQADPHGILTGRLDLARIGVFGFSGGGIVAGEACRLDPRLRACLIMDAPVPTDVVEAGLQQPTMWITRDAANMRLERARAGGWSEEEIDAHQTSMRAAFASLPGDGYFVQVPGTFHINFCDLALLSPLASTVGLAGPLDARRAHRIINAYSLAFFDRHVKGLPALLLDGPADQYPEVRLETRRPVAKLY